MHRGETQSHGLEPVKPAERLAWAVRSVLDAVERLRRDPHDRAHVMAVLGRHADYLRLVDAHPSVREITVTVTEARPR